MNYKKTERSYHMMLFPGMLLLVIFHFVPMGGIIMAFQNFKPIKGIFGSQFIGLRMFRHLFQMPDFYEILRNTLIIAVGKISIGMVVAIFFAILLNETRGIRYKKFVQTSVYLPHFLSWVILTVIFSNFLSFKGPINQFLGLFGVEPQMFLVSNRWFRTILVLSDVWKEFGYNAIVYVAAMTAIDPGLYEAARIDGANKLQEIFHITIPGIMPTIVLMMILNIGHIFDAGFDQVYNLYSPLVYETGDIIDTYVYRVGLTSMQYSLGTAVGLFKSVISFALLAVSYKLADHFAGYKLF